MNRYLIGAVMTLSAGLLMSGCASTKNESAGAQPDNTLRHRVDTQPENDGGIGNQHKSTPTTYSVARPTDEKTQLEYRKLSEGILDENGNPTQESAGATLKKADKKKCCECAGCDEYLD